MTRAGMKMLLVIFGLLGITSSFGQDVTLKKLYNRIEDLEQGEVFRTRSRLDYSAEGAILTKRLDQKMFSMYTKGCTQEYFEQGFYASNAIPGSFTKKNSSQKAVIYRYCVPIESYDFGCTAIVCGIAIIENQNVIANFVNRSDYAASYGVKDINQNGLTELMIVVQSQAKGSWGDMDAVQLLEFENAQPTSLGSFFVGGPPSFFDTLGIADMVIHPSSICTSNAPRELQKSFPSNIIYVQKGKVPQFFAEGWEVNCDYLEKGVKARKVSSLTPIKPVPRAVPLTRLF